MLKRGLFACAVLGIATSAFAGARIDIRPQGLTVNPPDAAHNNRPWVTAAANTNYTTDVFLVDTGNPQGNIGFRGLFLDSADSTGVTYGDPDGAGPLVANNYNWENPFGIGATFPGLPNTSWVYPLPTANPLFQITLPDNGEVKIGTLVFNSGALGSPALVDVTNHDASDPNFGARADFGFGGAGDPVTTWRAFTGDLTGGTLGVFAVPEPATIALLGVGALALIRRRRPA